MILKLHKSLGPEQWRKLPWDKRILNISAELIRAKTWNRLKKDELVTQAIERALELVDLTVEAGGEGKPRFFLREFLRLREALAAFYTSAGREEGELRALFKALLDLDERTYRLKLPFD